MPRYQRWVFEVDAPRDAFARALKDALAGRGVLVRDARFFDFSAEAWGARALVKLAHADDGIEVVVKLKSGLFGSPAALEDAILQAGRGVQGQLFRA